jgi:glutathione S-transferase
MIRLHHCHQTRSMRTLWLLYELEVDFDLVLYPFDDTLRTDAYRTLNPLGRVPALEIEGEVMTETGAIAEYLCEAFPDAGLGRPPGDLDRMDWLVWIHFAETITQHTAALTQQHIAIFDDSMRSPTVMKLEARRLAKCYEVIEGRLSTPVENRDYILTSGFSAADIGVGQAVYMGQHFVKLDGYPELTKWYQRITEREEFKKSLPPEDEGNRLYARDLYPPWDGPRG